MFFLKLLGSEQLQNIEKCQIKKQNSCQKYQNDDMKKIFV